MTFTKELNTEQTWEMLVIIHLSKFYHPVCFPRNCKLIHTKQSQYNDYNTNSHIWQTNFFSFGKIQRKYWKKEVENLKQKKFYPGPGIEPGPIALHASALNTELCRTSRYP